jgi:putative hydrolase of HD superfamily
MVGSKKRTQFLFAVPTVEIDATPGAVAALQLSAIASRLVGVVRTRCTHADGRAENDAEHSFMLAKVAPELARLLYPELNEDLVARYSTLHDDVEAYVGDTPTDMLARHNPQAKKEREAAGLAQLLVEYAHLPAYCQRLREYEAQSVPEARFVRAVDKLMVLLIHIPNKGAVLRKYYTYDSFLQCEAEVLARDTHKYGEFGAIMDLRRELGNIVAERYLSNTRDGN